MAQISRTVDNAMSLLKHLSEHGPATALQVSRDMQLNRTIVHRLLVTLERQGFVRRQGSAYSLGFSILQLADRVEDDIRTSSRPGLERLAKAFDETAVLAVPDGTDSVVVDQFVAGGKGAQIRYRLGFRNLLAFGGHGRAILAFSPPEVVASTLERLSEQEADWVRRSLEEVRTAGYAFSSDELRSGTSGLAVPVRNRHGLAVASIGIVSPVSRFPDVSKVLEVATDVAREIEQGLAR
ncbi:MAG TPA: IclR family transcriptional regulator [Actinopolymorphaceae bacterium]